MKTTEVGYINKNNQKNHGYRGVSQTHYNQKFFEMECLDCGHRYMANGCDVWLRKCPECGTKKKISKCAECGSQYIASKSKMTSLCPECAHLMYGYDNCKHVFKKGRCTRCHWDGSYSEYTKGLKNQMNTKGQTIMRKNFGPKCWLYPMPVFVVGSYDENGTPNAMVAAWGGMYDTDQVIVCLAGDHKTTANIKKSGAFTISFATTDTIAACDYVGIVSGNDVPDKFAKAGFNAVKSEYVNAPVITELPMTVECELIKFNEDGICIGQIVNVSADESVLDENGRIDAKKLDPIIYDGATHAYWSFGEKVGQAFSDGKKIK